MPSPEQPVLLRHGRSAFAAAFLSLLFPGLGHAYAGAYSRALAWAAAPILVLALVGGIALRMRQAELLGYVVANLGPIFVVNVVLLVYRAAAIVDAWRVVTYLNAYEASGGGRLGRPRIPVGPLPAAGLLAVLLVMSGAHVAVAQYDLKLSGLVTCVFDVTGTANCEDAGGADESPLPGDDSPVPTEPGSSAIATPNGSVGSPLPSVAPTPPPDLTKRFNILLIGSDQRPKQGTYNTDTMIVVSIDPATKQVAMFTLPRDAVDVPVPAGPAQSVFGTTYRGKINGWLTSNRNRSDLWPGPASQRGFTALKAILGYLYGLDIRYYVEVNFAGFRKVVDAVGGVSINVQVPVVDDDYPGDDGHKQRIYIPAGYQHMTGAQALIYARSRHGSNDFDRGARQQRVLVSLREQTDPATLIPRLDDLIAALKTAVHTDIPVGILPQLLDLASDVDTRNIRSYVFAPPFYGSEPKGDPRGYVLVPRIDRIRAAVQSAFTANPADEALRQALSEEGARLWVLNGTGETGEAARIAAFLDDHGIEASSPNQRPDTRGLKNTKIVVYNGAEAKIPETLAYLKTVFGVTPTTASDPTVLVDVIVTTARSTPELTPRPAP
jgi:LCP family protein required for cell wall assembly